MKTLEGLLEFTAVAQNGTFTQAAAKLRVSVSHISRQIADLELRLGAQLFARTTRQMHLTAPGERLLRSAQPLLDDLFRAQEAILQSHDVIEGHIRISLAGKFSEASIAPVLLEFARAHPALILDLDFSARNVDLMAEGFDLAVRMGPLKSASGLIASRLTGVPSVVLASRRLLKTLPPIETPRDLPAQLCFPLAGRAWRFARGSARSVVKPESPLSSNSGIVAVQAACNGQAIVKIPRYYWATQTKDLKTLLTDWLAPDETTFYLVYPANRHLPWRVRSLIDFLRAQPLFAPCHQPTE